MDYERIYSARLWAFIVLTAGATACAMVAAGLSFDWSSALPPFLVCLCFTAVVWFYRHRRPDAGIATALDSFAQLTAFAAIGGALSYAVAAMDRPLWNARFYVWDRAFGLNWRAYLAFVNARPWLGHCYTIAYGSFGIQVIVAIVGLCFAGKLRACRQFVLAFMIAALVTILISGYMPAGNMFVDLGLRHARDFPNLAPVADFIRLHDLNALRDGTLRVVALQKVQGIVAFPSFHAALGVIFAAAFWELRWLRWPGVALNAVLIASTPIDGGHYFVDVAAGVALAALSVAFVRHLDGRKVFAPAIESAEPANQSA